MKPPVAFELVRTVDASGVTGPGEVAWGVESPDGVCVLRWRLDIASTAVYASLADVEAIHGHGGLTRVRWLG